MTIIRKVLIANRGEIAVRVIKTCQRMGIETVLCASEADLNSMAARIADQVVCIGPPPSTASYLKVEAIVEAAVSANVNAIHPGYGFLSENQTLAAACERVGIIFIGPTIEQLDAVGDKLKARANALAADLPVVPGGNAETIEDARKICDEIGYPILIKAVGGGGGRGMKLVEDPSLLESTMNLAMAEARNAFGDARVYIERYVKSGRHVEVQVLADGENTIHLGTRDCSIQRRYQKLVEEAPAPNLSDTLRQKMHDAAIKFSQHLHYRGLGTVELLVDCERDTFYFLEMNARIQVEHPVTEAICGLDLVEEQILVAEGRALRYRQEEIEFFGHAFECRINAEDWSQDFQPSPGKVSKTIFPAGEDYRIDTHMYNGATVPPFYDSLIAKLIVADSTRENAILKMQRALELCEIEGITTNIPMHKEIFNQRRFKQGGFDTGFFPWFMENHASIAKDKSKEDEAV